MSRSDNFTGLRLCAALTVASGHVAMMTGAADPIQTQGLRGRLLFFVISGFLLAASWKGDPHAGRFLARRGLRIYPSFALVVIVCAALGLATSEPDSMRELASWFYLNNLWFHGIDWTFFHGPRRAMNDSIWMIPIEVGLYLIFACVASCGDSIRSANWPVIALSVVVAMYYLFDADRFMIHWTIEFGIFFCAGVALYHLTALRSTVATVWLMAIGAWLSMLDVHFLVLVIAPAAVWVGLRSWPVLRSAGRFGDLSYGLFLWHWPVLQFLVLPHTHSYAHALVAGIAITLPIALIQWHLIDKNMMTFRPRKRVRSTGPALSANLPTPQVDRLRWRTWFDFRSADRRPSPLER